MRRKAIGKDLHDTPPWTEVLTLRSCERIAIKGLCTTENLADVCKVIHARWLLSVSSRDVVMLCIFANVVL